MPVVMVIAIIAVVAVTVVVATGRGGELSAERSDYAPLELGPVSATDVALLRPPSGLWGYSVEATDEALEQIAEAIRERDVRIVALEQLVTDLSREHAPMSPLAGPYGGARHRRTVADTMPDAPRPASYDSAASGSAAFDPAPFDPEAVDSAWLPSELPGPDGDNDSSPPPEQSHD